MQLPTIPKKLPTFAKFNQMSKRHKISAAGALAAAAVVLTVTGLEATAGAGSATAASAPTGVSASAATHAEKLGVQEGAASQKSAPQPKSDLATQQKTQAKGVLAAQAEKRAADTAAKKQAADAAAKKQAATEANERAKAKAAANRATHRAHVAVAKKTTTAPKKAHIAAHKPTAKHYANNLDGWIRQSLDIMHKKGIPGTYEGIHRNITRESSGNPKAINLWDINARNGIPSKGLLQVIDPTFNTYHVAGTSHDIYDPVANITAACNYAADRYGTMDNVNSAY
jgi:hypothetical protein